MSEGINIEHWLNTKEIAEHLGVTVETIRKWIKAEKIPCHRVSVSYGSLELARWMIGLPADRLRKTKMDIND